jgi:membrane-bound lytic murein transglycosylase D
VLLAGCFRSAPPAPPSPSPVGEGIELATSTTVPVPDLGDLDLSALEPAPFQEAPDSLPELEGDLPGGLDLRGNGIPLVLNDRVQFWIDLFTGRERERFALYLTRQGRFEDMIFEKLDERGMPRDLLYLALIESGFSPIARSRARAVGMWQFIAATARTEGLIVSELLDERRSVERSTDAALNHLTRLHDRYDSWYLAAAAYNSGAGRVDRALRIRARGEAGADSLFWKIHASLPRETRDYVPKLVAAAIIGKNREAFGFGDVVPEAPDDHDRVTIPDATDFDVIAEAAGVSTDLITQLNPHLPRGVTPPGRVVEVNLPAGTADAFEVAYARIPPEERVRFKIHIVRRGETLSGIAARYGSSVRLIQEASGIRNAGRISIGQEVRIPSAAAVPRSVSAASTRTSAASVAPSSSGTTTGTYRVRPGDSLWIIARRIGVSWKDLMRWNKLTERSIIRPGDRLIIRGSS